MHVYACCGIAVDELYFSVAFKFRINESQTDSRSYTANGISRLLSIDVVSNNANRFHLRSY